MGMIVCLSLRRQTLPLALAMHVGETSARDLPKAPVAVWAPLEIAMPSMYLFYRFKLAALLCHGHRRINDHIFLTGDHFSFSKLD